MSVNLSIDPTIARLYTSLERAQDTTPRNYLGMSAMGEPCDRKLWYDFRQLTRPKFAAKTLCAFADGHYSEDVTAERLKAVEGITLEVDNGEGEQIGFVDFGGHFRGHMDGQILGVSEAPKVWHVWEHKCSAEKTYKKFTKALETLPPAEVLEAWNLKYFAQAQLYMHYSGMKRHYLTVSLAGSREYSAVRTKYQAHVGERLKDRASDIIASNKPLDKITLKTDSFECRFCDHKPICHSNEIPAPHCRTCIFSYPIVNDSEAAQWGCSRYKRKLERAEMHSKCDGHLFIPALLENVAEMQQADRERHAIEYVNKKTGELFWNGSHVGAYSSRELRIADFKAVGDKTINEIKETFGAEIKGQP